MNCEYCEKHEATTYIKTIVNGDLSEVHICSDCAKKLGYNSVMGNFGTNINQFIGTLFNPVYEKTTSISSIQRCPICGSTFNDIAHSVRVGCAMCYETFYERLLPSIQRMHGNTTHNGKIPNKKDKNKTLKSKFEDTKEKLKQAIEKQDFEQAVILRDSIIEMEREINRHE